jgi:RimJ/RimL family protein N-acetyltransferase
MGAAFGANRGDDRGHGVDSVRRLVGADAAETWRLRREALERDPASFGESVEEHLKTSPAAFAERLASGGSESFVYGAFDGQKLVAMVGFYREKRIKRRHKGVIWGVYVTPAYRGGGVARAVMTSLLDSVRALPGLKCIYLSVTAEQPAARNLYASLGFRSFGLEPRALAVNGEYLDEEHMILEL